MIKTMRFSVPPQRVPSIKKLLKRIQRAADSRKIRFEWEIGEPGIVDLGAWYVTPQVHKRQFNKLKRIGLWKPSKSNPAMKYRPSMFSQNTNGSLFQSLDSYIESYAWQNWHEGGEQDEEPPRYIWITDFHLQYPPDFNWVKKTEMRLTASGGEPYEYQAYGENTDETMLKIRKVQRQSKVIVKHDLFGKSDWEVLATIEPIGGGEKGNPVIMRTVPSISKIGDEMLSKKAPKKYPHHCDHCSVKRKRNKLIAVMHKKRKRVRFVGTTCLFEYTNIDPNMLEKLYNIQHTLKGSHEYQGAGGGAGAKERPVYSLNRFLEIACSYYSARGAYEKGSGKHLLNVEISNNTKAIKNQVEGRKILYEWFIYHIDRKGKMIFGGWLDLVGENAQPSETTRFITNSVLDFMDKHFAGGSKNNFKDWRSTFERNLITIYEAGIVDSKSASFAASMYVCWANWFKRQADEKLKAKTKTENTVAYPAEIGDKIGGIEAEVIMTRGYNSMYGDGTIVLMRSAKGDLKWFSSSANIPRLGMTINIERATAKKKDSFKGDESLIVNRVKWGEIMRKYKD